MEIIDIDENKELISKDLENTNPYCDDDEEKKIVNQHHRNLEDKKYNDTYFSCCLVIDRRALEFFSQLIVICMVMLFSIYQLTTLPDCESQTTYIGLLTLLLGILIPAPRFSH
jgi:hypothetical protein